MKLCAAQSIWAQRKKFLEGVLKCLNNIFERFGVFASKYTWKFPTIPKNSGWPGRCFLQPALVPSAVFDPLDRRKPIFHKSLSKNLPQTTHPPPQRTWVGARSRKWWDWDSAKSWLNKIPSNFSKNSTISPNYVAEKLRFFVLTPRLKITDKKRKFRFWSVNLPSFKPRNIVRWFWLTTILFSSSFGLNQFFLFQPQSAPLLCWKPSLAGYLGTLLFPALWEPFFQRRGLPACFALGQPIWGGWAVYRFQSRELNENIPLAKQQN